MWRGFRRLVGRTLVRAAGEAVSLVVLALLVAAGALWVTGEVRTVGSFLRTTPTATESARASPAARPPLLDTVARSPLRARPRPELEAHTRIFPLSMDVHTVGLALSIVEVPALAPGDRVEAEVTFYYCVHSEGTPIGDGGNFCGLMRDGTAVYPGAAACHYDYLGQTFRIEGDPTARVYRCSDTGSAIDGLHRDIWFATSQEGWDWQRAMGPSAMIEILP
jgi:hypothetical protein